jgi:Tfp pilus assembly protein FimT
MTLVEMGVVLAAIAVLAALGIPSLMKMVPRVKLNNSAMVLSNDIAVTRMRAISKSADFHIVFNPGLGRYQTKKWGGPTDFQDLGTTIINGTVPSASPTSRRPR